MSDAARMGRLILVATSGKPISQADAQEMAHALLDTTNRAAAYEWGYKYLQDRMKSIDRHGWAHDCDSEIAARIDGGV